LWRDALDDESLSKEAQGDLRYRALPPNYGAMRKRQIRSRNVRLSALAVGTLLILTGYLLMEKRPVQVVEQVSIVPQAEIPARRASEGAVPILNDPPSSSNAETPATVPRAQATCAGITMGANPLASECRTRPSMDARVDRSSLYWRILDSFTSPRKTESMVISLNQSKKVEVINDES
jgi:hypothetical protein